jgi:hypothetical protein
MNESIVPNALSHAPADQLNFFDKNDDPHDKIATRTTTMHRSLCFFLLLLASQQQVLVVGFRNFLRNNGGGLANPLDGLFSISASSRSHTPIEPPLKRRPEPEKCTVGDPCERCEGKKKKLTVDTERMCQTEAIEPKLLPFSPS